jgi:hypothetical protein
LSTLPTDLVWKLLTLVIPLYFPRLAIFI